MHRNVYLPVQHRSLHGNDQRSSLSPGTATIHCHRCLLQLSVAAALQHRYFSSIPPTATASCLIANLSWPSGPY